MTSPDSVSLVVLATSGLPVATSLNHYAAKARATIGSGDADALSARADTIRNSLLTIVVQGTVAHPADVLAVKDRIAKAFASLAKSIDGLAVSVAASEPKAALSGAAAANIANALVAGDTSQLSTALASAEAVGSQVPNA